MARFFPVRSQCQFDTPGERRFAERAPALPEPSRCGSDWQEWNNHVTRLGDEQANRRILSDMAVLSRSEFQARSAEHSLIQAQEAGGGKGLG